MRGGRLSSWAAPSPGAQNAPTSPAERRRAGEVISMVARVKGHTVDRDAQSPSAGLPSPRGEAALAPGGGGPAAEGVQAVGAARPDLDGDAVGSQHLEAAGEAAGHPQLARDQQAATVGGEAGQLDVADVLAGIARPGRNDLRRASRRGSCRRRGRSRARSSPGPAPPPPPPSARPAPAAASPPAPRRTCTARYRRPRSTRQRRPPRSAWWGVGGCRSRRGGPVPSRPRRSVVGRAACGGSASARMVVTRTAASS